MAKSVCLLFCQLLNDKSEDDDVEARAGLKRPNELLQQLLKEDEERPSAASNAQEDSLLKSLGFSGSSPPGTSSPQVGECSSVGSGGRKRPSLESDDGAGGKRLQQHTPMSHSPVQPMSIPSAASSTPSQASTPNIRNLLVTMKTKTRLKYYIYISIVVYWLSSLLLVFFSIVGSQQWKPNFYCCQR